MVGPHVSPGWRHISTAPIDGTKIRARDAGGWEATVSFSTAVMGWLTESREQFYPIEWKPR